MTSQSRIKDYSDLPKLSIVIISKNEEELLPKLLESIKQQTYQGFEVIVSDAQSTDKTREIVDKYGYMVVEGGLPSVGRNNGAKYAKHDLILFLDSDVYLPPDFLEHNLAEFQAKSLACATPIYKPLSDKTLDKVLFASYNVWARAMQYIYPHSSGWCIFCTKYYWSLVDGFPEHILLAEDHAFVNSVKEMGGRFRLLTNVPVYVDVRRLEKEGRFTIVTKYVKGGALRIIRGDKEEPMFEYVLHGQDKGVKEMYEENVTKQNSKRTKK